MQLIKISSGDPKYSELFARQCPEPNLIWNNCKFVVNEDVDKCDWWVVCHASGLRKKESTYCDPQNTIYISMEPSEAVVNVTPLFLSQFNQIVTVDRLVDHPNVINKNVHTWWVGVKVEHKNNHHHFSNYDYYDYSFFKAMDVPVKKNRISVILSNKSSLPGHVERMNFIDELLKLPIAKYIDLYGSKYHPIADKLDGIASYKYHLVFENSIVDDYWTEKLSDI
jgi:hypothetical protein